MKAKKILFIAIFSIIGFTTTYATVWTVSNNAYSPGQYTDLQVAIDDSANVKEGDTLYVHGSATSYGNITLNRRLTLIGTGFNPEKDLPLTSQLGIVSLDTLLDIFSNPVSGASGSEIIGFLIVNNIYDLAGFTGIRIDRNRIDNYGNYSNSIQLNAGSSNWVISNNILQKSQSSNNSGLYTLIRFDNAINIIVSNNIFTHMVSGASCLLGGNSTTLISNNIFLGLGVRIFSATTPTSFAQLTNNIFYGTDQSNCNNCVFTNNLTFQTVNDTIPYGTNTGTGNIIAQNPLFVNVVPADYNYNDTYDYHLSGGSPGKNAGTDATDIGHFGGTSPFIESGMPAIPQVVRMNVQSTIVFENDTLQIDVRARKQD